ncbi:MAG: glycoside hydrolase family 113 [Candidatus Saccharibacteria bacterium]
MLYGNRASASVSTWQKGASIVPQSTTDFSSSSFRQSLSNLASTHANYVTLVVPYYQSNENSIDIQSGWNTPTDQSLADGIKAAHAAGLQVNLKPHLDTYVNNQWRAYINPGDRNGWFTNYGNMLNHLGQIGQANGAEEITTGTELISMASDNINSTNTQNWQNMIANLRKIYSGKLTYSANWGCCGFTDEKNNIAFWGSLDYAGISAYYNLGGDFYNDSVPYITSQWDNYNKTDIGPFQQRIGKPVIFTEIGYRSVTGAHTQPWNYNLGGPVDQAEQANSYEALFSYWDSQPNMQGVQLWDWSSNPNAGGNDTNYTPQNKQAQTVMTKWFGGSGGTTPPPPSGNPTITSSASASPNPVSAGSQTTVTAQVTNSGQSVSGANVDVEIYNASNQRAFQQIYANQNFNSGQFQAYNFGWTPQAQGTYTVKIGVFNGSWTQLYNWQDSAATITVGTGSTPPPPPPPPHQPPPRTSGPIDGWWPTNSSTLSGTQPFKALLTNADVGSYNMYWQVDNGGLNAMYDSSQDWPHKEAIVDLSGWNWNGSGPYTLNFVAKDKNGNVIAQRQIVINITH